MTAALRFVVADRQNRQRQSLIDMRCGWSGSIVWQVAAKGQDKRGKRAF